MKIIEIVIKYSINGLLPKESYLIRGNFEGLPFGIFIQIFLIAAVLPYLIHNILIRTTTCKPLDFIREIRFALLTSSDHLRPGVVVFINLVVGIGIRCKHEQVAGAETSYITRDNMKTVGRNEGLLTTGIHSHCYFSYPIIF